jgi:hypothetical protein
MKASMCVIVAVCVSLNAWAQNRTYSSTRTARTTQFASKVDTIKFSDYAEIQPDRFERFAFTNSHKYKIVKSNNGNGEVVEEIFDESGVKLATTLLAGANKNSLVLKDGELLKFVSTGKTTWSYTKYGKDAIKCFYYMLNDEKHYAMQLEDSTITDPLIPVLILSYGSGTKHVHRNKNKTAAILTVVGMSTLLAVMRFTMDDF